MAVQELLGHESVEMALRYAHLSPDVKRDAAQLLDRPPRELAGPKPPRSRRLRCRRGTGGAHGGGGMKNAPTDRGVRWSGKRDLKRTKPD